MKFFTFKLKTVFLILAISLGISLLLLIYQGMNTISPDAEQAVIIDKT